MSQYYKSYRESKATTSGLGTMSKRTKMAADWDSTSAGGSDSNTVGGEARMNDFAGETMTSSGGAGSSGDMPRTSLNNPFSGHVIAVFADELPAPIRLLYRDVWSLIKKQHIIMSKWPDVAKGAPETDIIQLTVTKVEMYGASAGMISMQPYIQRSGTTHSYEPPTITTTERAFPVGQQMVDVGTINQKPYLSHYFGDSIKNTREINVDVQDYTNFSNDPLVRYQFVQLGATPVPVDAGYLRISFILRNISFVPLTTAFTPTSVMGLPEQEQERHILKRRHESEQMVKIDRIKRLTMPALDSNTTA